MCTQGQRKIIDPDKMYPQRKKFQIKKRCGNKAKKQLEEEEDPQKSVQSPAFQRKKNNLN